MRTIGCSLRLVKPVRRPRSRRRALGRYGQRSQGSSGSRGSPVRCQTSYAHVRINYRTPTQLGLLERFHQTLKTEEIYWHLYQSPAEARERLEAFRELYNTVRPHWALQPEGGGEPLTPHDVYVHGRATTLPAWQTWARPPERSSTP